jgi:WD40 repeat protein
VSAPLQPKRARGPYPGLRPFDRDEDDLFFGREEQVDQLLDKLADTHFLAVLGTSGLGKSSLVRAGLLPALDSGFMGAAGARWTIAELRPGGQPFRRLAAALVEHTEWGRVHAAQGHGEGAAPADGAIAELEQHLRSGSMALNWRLGVQPLPEGTRLLILVDQFEELFRYQHGNRREAADFVALLLAAATLPDVYLVITLRSEFLGNWSAYPGLPEAINRGLFLTPALTPEQMADAIQLPVKLPEFGGSVEPELVLRLLEEARGQTDQLPLLQHAIMRLWDLDDGDKRLTLTEFEALGGLRQVLNVHVDEAFAELDQEQQRIAEVLFRGLTERDTRRPVRLGEIADLAGVDWTSVAAVVEVFRKPGRCFLVPPADEKLTREMTLDITHEALIRQWQRLQTWAADEAQRAEQYRRWRERALHCKRGVGSPLTGADLARALEWQAGRDGWQPTVAWAARYAPEPNTAKQEFDLTLAYIDKSKTESEALERERHAQKAAEEARRAVITARSALLEKALLKWKSYGGYGDDLEELLLDEEGLVDAVNSARENPNELTDPEKQFIESCEGALRKIRADLASFKAGELAKRSEAMQNTNRQGSLLLAIEAFNITQKQKLYVPVADSALREALSILLSRYAPSCEGRLLFDHGSSVNTVAISRRWLVTGSEDGVVRLWNLDTLNSNKLDVLHRDNHAIRTAALSDQENWLVTGSEDRTVCLWLWESGNWVIKKAMPLGSAIQAVAFSQNEFWLFIHSEDKTIHSWKFWPSFSDPNRLEKDGILAFAIDKYNHFLFTGHDDGKVLKWRLDNTERPIPVDTFSEDNKSIHAIAVSSDTHWLVTGSDDGTARLWNLVGPNPKKSDRLPGHKGKVCAMAISSNTQWLAIGSDDKTVRIWNLTKWNQIESEKDPVLRSYKDTIQRLIITSDNHWLAIGCRDGTIHLQDLTDLDTPSLTLQHPHDGEIRAMAISSDNHWLVTGSADKTARYWSLTGSSNSYPIVLNPAAGSIHAVAVSSNQRWLVTGSHDGIARLWDLQTITSNPSNYPTKSKELTSHPRGIKFNILAISPDNRWLVTCNEDSTARLWNLEEWSNLDHPPRSYGLTGHKGIIQAATFSTDNRWLVTVSDDTTARLWSLTEPDPSTIAIELPHAVKDPSDQKDTSGPVWVASITSDNHWLVTAGSDGRVRLWDLQSDLRTAPSPSVELNPKAWGIRATAISPNNHWLAVGNFWDGNVRLWELNTLTNPSHLDHPSEDQLLPNTILSGHNPKKYFNVLIFSPNSRWLITCNNGSSARLWDLKDWNLPDQARCFELCGHKGIIQAATFSTDNRWLVTVSDDKTARLWDITVPNPATTSVVLRGHEGSIWTAVITPDSHWLITASDDGTVRLWALQLEKLAELARRTVTRNLTWKEWEVYFPNQGYRKTILSLPAHKSAIEARFKQAQRFAREGRKDEAKFAYQQVVKWAEEYEKMAPLTDGFTEIIQTCKRALDLEPDSAVLILEQGARIPT